MSATIPPGIPFLIKRFPRFLLPPTAVYLLYSVYHYYGGNELSSWRLGLFYALSFPVTLTVSVWYTMISDRVAAARMGAVMLPGPRIWEDPTPGGLLSLWRGVKGFKSAYPDALEQRIAELGPAFNLRLLFEDRVITVEPSHIKAFLATQFEDFEKGEDTRSTLSSLLGTGVFAVDGELWKFHRSITRPFFSRDRITHFHIFDRHAEAALTKMKDRFREGYAVDFQDVVSRFTLDSATEFLFGHNIGTLSDPLPYPFFLSLASGGNPIPPSFSAQFSRAFSEAQIATAYRARFGASWPLTEFWKDVTKEKMKPVQSFLEPILQEGVRRVKEAKENKSAQSSAEKEDAETVLDHLIKYTDDPIILRDEIMNLAVAGRDTTASLLTFTVYMLSQHPEVFGRLRKEIVQTIGPSRQPTYDDLREMRYLRAVLNETLRLYPPVPFDMRQANKRTLLPPITPGGKPFYVPSQARCIYSVFMMHRRTDLWGPDALTYDPDRFLDERLHKYLTPNPFIFLPFNAGPRICLGQQFAYNESSFFLVRLLQRFSSITLSEESQPPSARPPAMWKEEGGIKATEKIQIKTHLTMYVPEGLWLTMKEVSDAEEDII